MKPYLPIAVAAGLVVVGLAAALFLTPSLASPQARLDEEISGKIDQAQAMLAAYSPTDEALLRRFDAAATTQPGTAEQPGTDLDPQVKTALELRKTLIADALTVAQEAVGARVDEASWDSSTAATRLQAMLLIEQAQIHRREAEREWQLAAQARAQVRDLLAHWTAVNTQADSLQTTLSGQGVLVERAMRTAQPAAAAPTAAAPGEHSRLGSLIGRLLRGAKPPASPPVAVAPPPSEPAPPAPATVVAETRPTPRPSGPPACTLSSSIEDILSRQTQSPQQRIADLRLCRTQVEERLARAQQQADTLEPQVQQAGQQIAAAKAQADDAQKRMLALERAGVDATEPGSLERFTREFNDASTAYRRALRTVSILTAGSSATPRLTPEEQEMLLSPAIDVDPSLQTQHRGLLALESDLRASRALIETQKQLLAQIDRSIDRLTRSEEQLNQYLASEKTRRNGLAQDLAKAAKVAVSHALAAAQAESEALRVAGEAVGAAGRAQRASSASASGYVKGGAKALEGDAKAIEAVVWAQRAAGLENHAEMLEQISPAAIPPAALAPEMPAPDASGEAASHVWATQAAAALEQAAKARDAAVNAAKLAIDAYSDAANSAKQLWTLHAQIAAMHYLLGNLTGGPEAEKHLADARRTYDLATRDRRDRPEVQPLHAIYGKLAQAK